MSWNLRAKDGKFSIKWKSTSQIEWVSQSVDSNFVHTRCDTSVSEECLAKEN